jgi:predicted DNA-binding transcriptional regulator AlpA
VLKRWPSLEIAPLIWSDRTAMSGGSDDYRLSERWITKQELAEHLSVSRRWMELQQPLGLPHIRTTGMTRYRVSEVDAWLRKQYGSPSAQDGGGSEPVP